MPQIATFPHCLPNLLLIFYLALPDPTSLYYFPLRTTSRHILNGLQISSREIVRSCEDFWKIHLDWCFLFSAERNAFDFVVGHDTLLPRFRFFFVAVSRSRRAFSQFGLHIRFQLLPSPCYPLAARPMPRGFGVLNQTSRLETESYPWNGPHQSTKKLT